MKAQGVDTSELGKDDGIFWMSLTDFFLEFRSVYLCRFFEQDWKEINLDGEWSTAKKTAGGCMNNESCVENYNLQLDIVSHEPIELYVSISTKGEVGQKKSKRIYRF
jgi:hypothetical protein